LLLTKVNDARDREAGIRQVNSSSSVAALHFVAYQTVEMPPKTEDLHYQASSDDSPVPVERDASTVIDTGDVPTPPVLLAVKKSRSILPSKDSVPFLKRRQVSTASSAALSGSLNRVLENGGEDCFSVFVSTIETLEVRVSELVAALDAEEKDTVAASESNKRSPVRDACRQSLTTRMPHVLRQCKVLVERVAESSRDVEESGQNKMIATLRSGFALVAAVQFLDTVQEAIYGGSRPALDRRLEEVTELALHERVQGEGETLETTSTPLFRVSHWLAPALAFDAACGSKVCTRLPGDSKQLPLDLEVEPVISYMADDLASGSKPVEFRQCSVEVLDCRHRPSEFTEGAGGLGVAYVRIRVSPLYDGSASSPIRIWGEEEVEKLTVKEVRVYV
jgi:hypothetical protein